MGSQNEIMNELEGEKERERERKSERERWEYFDSLFLCLS